MHSSIKANAVIFDWFAYSTPELEPALAKSQFRNPVLPGFYPDPSITRKGKDFYLVTSTFAYTPGLPIFHSKNLVDWRQVGFALTRQSGIDFDGLSISRGIFAPTIRYYNDVFYLITTAVDSGGNFLLTARDPAGPWSKPIWLKEVGGIDPDLFFDDNGKAYVTHNDAPPGEPLYNGHRSIWMWELDLTTKSVVAGTRRLLVDGGVDISQRPVWIEGPHIYKKDGWYYLICAEGGTGPQHSQVIFRTRSLDLPFEPYAGNPILTQRHLPFPRENAVDAAGHADFIQGPDGRWFSVFLATRPYGDNRYNTGRETFLLPMQWEDDWPTILTPDKAIPLSLLKPYPEIEGQSTNFNSWRDDFSEPQLSWRWQGVRTFDRSWLTLEDDQLHLAPLAASLSTVEQVAYIGVHQAHSSYEVSTSVLVPDDEDISGGLVAFQSEAFHYFLGVSRAEKGARVFIERTIEGDSAVIATESLSVAAGEPVYLRISGHEGEIQFYFGDMSGYTGIPSHKEIPAAKKLDGRLLSTQTAGGFVGTTLGLHVRQD
ncbi:glycoside hydrolase family 43 protein [Alteromonas sp. D210916BOD_24]